MANQEIRALGQVSGEGLARVVATVRGVHRAVAKRTFSMLGPVARPVEIVHDAIAHSVYGIVEGAQRLVPEALATGVAAFIEDEPLLSASPAGTFVLGALNGAYGDTLAGAHSPLALTMTLRHRGRPVEASPEGLAAAFPAATSRLAVFIHGLCETDRSWFSPPPGGRRGPPVSHGQRLQRDLGYTPLYLRYNTGLHVSDNGLALARLLEQVVENWPHPVDEVVLVGHSMGGLVARSACQQATTQRFVWVDAVRHVVCLATPHLGSHVEQGANVIGHALGLVPETRPFARALNARSVGIKDLRFGSLLEADWAGHDPDEFLNNRCQEVPFSDSVHYYFIGATITRHPHHPIGRAVGDLLVQYPSASGTGRRRVLPFEVDKGRHLGGLHHFSLLNHQAIYDQLRLWLDPVTAEDGPAEMAT